MGSSTGAAPRIAIHPHPAAEWMIDAVRDGGAEVVAVRDAEAVVWADPANPAGLRTLLDERPDLAWVQLPWAGIEPYVHILDDDRVWTCGKGVYAEPVAEHALALALAGMRHVVGYSRASEWSASVGRNLLGAHVTIAGGGGITESLVRLLTPFDCRITVVRNRVQEMDGVHDVVAADRFVDSLAGADLVVLALALTPETEGIMSRDEFEMMERHAWLVNVARGKHVVTDDLVWALGNDVIGGAGLDVTEPEPLPAGHPLWSLPNCVITPHTGNTDEMAQPLLAARIKANVTRFAAGEKLIGLVDVGLGY